MHGGWVKSSQAAEAETPSQNERKKRDAYRKFGVKDRHIKSRDRRAEIWPKDLCTSKI